ncbi:MAG: M1 family metallopeptidase, partial [Flavobacteriales bacterium]|nr:M1 family metallopeptidase [Flavobacteriales bacterium]
MNKELLLITTFIAISCLQISAQKTPYFQQTVDHNIHVQLNDVDHELDAEIWTQYVNNSPDELDYLWYHVWPNAYSSAKSALAKQQFRERNLFLFYAMARDLGGIDGLDFKINGETARWEIHNQHPDIVKVHLNTPLQPGESLEINTPFHVRIPSGEISRLGHVKQSYQITQWYPKPAVYDRDGWHEMPYLGQGEFYSEFGTFDVHITLPSNYTIGATGDMPISESNNNAEEIQRLEQLDQDTRTYFKEKDMSDEMENVTNEFPESSNTLKTLHYHQEKIHDFAWFADKRFKVLKDSVTLPHSSRQVTTWAMFTPNEEDLWREAPDYLGDATYYYSLWNGDYPYNQVTAIDGTISAGGGMEYPNVTVIGESGSAFSLDVVIAHEVGHNWFYGILGSNERTNAWMDEGINSFNETRYLLERYGDSGDDLGLISSRLSDKWMERLDIADFEYRWIDELAYIFPARFGTDQPLQCHSDAFTSINYGAMVYKKTAAVFAFLRQYLGTERFDKAMQQYFEDWKFKHPSPSDMRTSLENSSGEDLGWFFDGFINTSSKNDWAISRVKSNNTSTSVTVKNKGEMTSPVEIVAYNEDNEVGRVWVDPSNPGSKADVLIPGSGTTHIVLDPERYDLDYDRQNNNARTKGMLRKVEPVQIRLGTRLEDGSKTQVFWLPVIAWNAHNKMMFGATIHNTTVPLRDFEWMATPLINKNAQLAGFSRVSYHTGPLSINLRGQRFSTEEYIDDSNANDTDTAPMNRISLSIMMKFNAEQNSNWASQIKYESVVVNGFNDNRFYATTPYRTSHNLAFDAIKKRGKILGLQQKMGFETRQFITMENQIEPQPVGDELVLYKDV